MESHLIFGGRCWHGLFRQVKLLNHQQTQTAIRCRADLPPIATLHSDELINDTPRVTQPSRSRLLDSHPFAVWLQPQPPSCAYSTSFCSSGSRLALDARDKYFLAFSLFPDALRMMP